MRYIVGCTLAAAAANEALAIPVLVRVLSVIIAAIAVPLVLAVEFEPPKKQRQPSALPDIARLPNSEFGGEVVNRCEPLPFARTA